MSDRDAVDIVTGLDRLMATAENQRKHQDQHRVRCPECDTTVWKDTVEEAVETAETHEDKRHDGEPTVEVDGVVLPSFTEEEQEQLREAIGNDEAAEDGDD